MSDDSNKTYPTASPEVARMMGLPSSEEVSHAPATSMPVANLPVVDLPHTEVSHKVGTEQKGDAAHGVSKAILEMEKSMENPMGVGSEEPVRTLPVFQIAKVIFPYIVVFGVGLFLYFFFFTKINFQSLFKSTPTPQTAQDTALQQLEKQNLGTYQAWIAPFYYDVSDASVLDPNGDNSGNGLTNFQKFLLNLNPKSYDTAGLGMSDSQALANGINPLSGQPLNDNQKQILDKYFDMETIMNKLALNKLNGAGSHGLVAGAQVFGVPQASASSTNAGGSDPLPQSTQNTTVQIAQGNNVVNANDLDINSNIPGRLQIPSLKVDAPLVFSKTTNDFDKDLLNGVIHYPGTAMPGQIGTTYISGHSSNYAWVKSNYNHVFTHLGDVAVDQSFQITVTLNNGKQAILHYVVTNSQQFTPTDPAQFANSGKSVVALSTCWPVGSTAKRLVVFGQLLQVEQ
jgi:LPXTG-site transpeptidase (sortase) family protein